jgi:erythromycin esterase-like protein
MELNRSIGVKLDRYVRFGEGDSVTLLRTAGFYRAWRDEEFASFLNWLRSWNEKASKPVRIFGIDNQDAGNDASVALAFVARKDPALAAKLRTPFGTLVPSEGERAPKSSIWARSVDAPTMAGAIAGAGALSAAIENHKLDWGREPDFADARYAANLARQNLVEYELDTKGTTFGGPRPDGYYSRRDVFMAENLLTAASGGEKIALWAHNEHVRRAVAPNIKGGTSLGTQLRAKLGLAYKCVGFTWSEGAISTVVGPLGKVNASDKESQVALVNDRPGELGSVFSRTGKAALWIDMTSRPHSTLLDSWVRTPYWFGSAGWGVDPLQWQTEQSSPGDEADLDQIFDVLVWFRKISPAHRIAD